MQPERSSVSRAKLGLPAKDTKFSLKHVLAKGYAQNDNGTSNKLNTSLRKARVEHMHGVCAKVTEELLMIRDVKRVQSGRKM